MNVTVNGKGATLADGTSIVMLLSQYGIKSPMTIVEVNQTVVTKEEWKEKYLSEGDNVEIIQLMGGG